MASGLTSAQRYYRKNAERLRQIARDKRARDPEAHREYVRKWKSKNPNRERERNLKKFGLTVEQYDVMHEQQNGLCAICQQPETSQRDGKVYRLAVDHDHNTGKVRGLLCFKCNSAMGSFEKRNVPLENVIKFLEQSQDVNKDYRTCGYCDEEYHVGWDADGAGYHEPFLCKGR